MRGWSGDLIGDVLPIAVGMFASAIVDGMLLLLSLVLLPEFSCSIKSGFMSISVTLLMYDGDIDGSMISKLTGVSLSEMSE